MGDRGRSVRNVDPTRRGRYWRLLSPASCCPYAFSEIYRNAGYEFGQSSAATQKHSPPHSLDRSPEKQLSVLLPKRRHGLRSQIHFLSEIRTESELPDSFDAANPGSKLGT